MIVAAVLVVGLAGALVYSLSSKNSPAQSSLTSTQRSVPTRSTHETTTTSHSSTTVTTSLLNEQAAAESLSTLLSQSVVDRSDINAASNDVSACGPTLSQDAQTFDAASSSRQGLITELSSLPGSSALPPQMIQSLTSAWEASEQVDQDYAGWASAELNSGCVPNDTSNTYYQEAVVPNQEATTDKQTFANLWNLIAMKYGLTTYQWDQL